LQVPHLLSVRFSHLTFYVLSALIALVDKNVIKTHCFFYEHLLVKYLYQFNHY
jgi:hypothetical protein